VRTQIFYRRRVERSYGEANRKNSWLEAKPAKTQWLTAKNAAMPLMPKSLSRLPKVPVRHPESKAVYEISTPDVKSIDELCSFLKIKEHETAKSRVYIHNGKPVLVLMLGNDEVNETKLTCCSAEKFAGSSRGAEGSLGADAGSIGPIGFDGRIIADKLLKEGNNLFSGANKNDYHLGGIDLRRDVHKLEYHDLRIVERGEECIRCGSQLTYLRRLNWDIFLNSDEILGSTRCYVP